LRYERLLVVAKEAIAITSDDWTLQAFAEALEQAVNGCCLSVEMSAPNYQGVVARGSGFQPSESLIVDLASGPEGGETASKCHTARHIHGSDFTVGEGTKIGKSQCDNHESEMQRDGSISFGRRQLSNPIANDWHNVPISLKTP
jgi:hypothetical protein